jgi:sec-independent protein translocase protein TatB
MLSLPHLVVLFVVALVIFGPEKLPELARTLGKLTAEFRKATGDLRSSFEEQMRQLEFDAAEIERKKRELAGKQAAAMNSAQSAGSVGAPQFTVAPEVAEPDYLAEDHSADVAKTPAPHGEPPSGTPPRIAPPTPSSIPHEMESQPEAPRLPEVNVHRS